MTPSSNVETEELYGLLEQFLVRLLSMGECESMDTLIDLDLSFSQARTLFVLAQHGNPVPIHEVARALRMSLASTGRNVDQLVTQGLAERREDEQDRRVRLVSLTDSGRAIAEKHVEAKRQGLRAFVGQLPADDCNRLSAALRPILASDCLPSSTLEGTRG